MENFYGFHPTTTTKIINRNFICSDKTPKGQPPAFLKKIGDIEVYEGMKAKFTACATGYPEPSMYIIVYMFN